MSSNNTEKSLNALAFEIGNISNQLLAGRSTDNLRRSYRCKSSQADKLLVSTAVHLAKTNRNINPSVSLKAAQDFVRVWKQRGDNAPPSSEPGMGKPDGSTEISDPNYQKCLLHKINSGVPRDEADLECREELGGSSSYNTGLQELNQQKSASVTPIIQKPAYLVIRDWHSKGDTTNYIGADTVERDPYLRNKIQRTAKQLKVASSTNNEPYWRTIYRHTKSKLTGEY